MFTGIVETVGRLLAIETKEGFAVLRIDLGPIGSGVKLGDSIAVAGVCLTVSALGPEGFQFEAIAETLERTRLGQLEVGDAVNLERAVAATGRLDGHIVQGHVDGVGRVRRFDREDHEALLHIECDEELAGQLVDKGSITIEGVSLTVVVAYKDGFHAALVPHTLEVTTLSELGVGDSVNLEVDVLGKYVKRYLDRVLPDLIAKSRASDRETSD
ncbi:MAG: riboflavin synthase [Myxococcota bacterium]